MLPPILHRKLSICFSFKLQVLPITSNNGVVVADKQWPQTDSYHLLFCWIWWVVVAAKKFVSFG